MRKKILIATSTFGVFSQEPINLLCENNFDIIRNKTNRKLEQKELAELISGCDAVIAGTEKYSSELIENNDNLKVISRLGVGLDNIESKIIEDGTVKILTTQTTPETAVAELAISLILSLLRSINVNDKNIKDSIWKKQYGSLLSNKTVGIIGLGRIGKEFINLTRGFNLNFYVFDKYPDKNFIKQNDLKLVELDKLLKYSDIITLHLELNDETKNLINLEKFKIMKKTALIINTSRAELINEDDLLLALGKKLIKGGGFDVFHNEPYSGELMKLNNVALTPHVGSYVIEIREKMELEAVQNIIDAFDV